MKSQAATVTPLVVTPQPYPDEALWGFILRTSVVNGYETPFTMLHYAGMDDNEARMAIPPPEKLAHLYARRPNELRELCYEWQGDSSAGHYTVFSHQLAPVNLTMKQVRVCPACVKGKGYVEKYWELRYGLVCPIHGQRALTHCPGCKVKLSWSREALLRCGCGHDLTELEQPSASPEVRELSRILANKLYGRPLSEEKNDALGFPLAQLEPMSLQTLMGLVDRLGRFGTTAPSATRRAHRDCYEQLERTAMAFANWPNGLYELLERVGRCSERSGRVRGIAKQFGHFLTSLWKTGLPAAELEFLRNAFVEFADTHWKKGFVDNRLHGGSLRALSHLVSRDAIAKHMDVMPITVDRMVKLGLIKPASSAGLSESRLLFDLTAELPKRCSDGRSLGDREAGKFLELPVAVIKQLRKLGVLKFKRIGKQLSSFHEYDLRDFRDALLALGSRVATLNSPNSEFLTLRAAMRLITGSSERKADIVAAILDGRLLLQGKVGHGVGDLVLKRDAVTTLVRDRAASDMGTRSAEETAALLRCSPTAIPWLVENRFLDSEPDERCLRIVIESIERFAAEYISCAELAQRHNTSSRFVVRHVKKAGIELLEAARDSSHSKQPFLRRSDLATVEISVAERRD